MADDTHTPPVGTAPEVKTVRWCSWHEDAVTDGVLVGAVEKPSGPPYPLYACAPCLVEHHLVPLAERPL